MSDITLEQVIQLVDQLDAADQMKLELHLKEERLQDNYEGMDDSVVVRAKLLAANFLVTDLGIPDELEDISDEELEELGRLPPGSPTAEQLIDEGRGPR